MKMYKTPTTDITAVCHSHAIMDMSASGTGLKGMKADPDDGGINDGFDIL